MTQQQYLTNYRMIYGITDGDKHLKWILTRRLGIVKLLTVCKLVPETLIVPVERWFDTEINSEKIENLSRDLTRYFLTRFLKSRRVRKAGPARLCELYITLYKTMQWRRWIKIDQLLIILFTIQNCTCEPFICKKIVITLIIKDYQF